MKSSKATSSISAQEACGVWLDTVHLKKSKKKRLARPISKLLNPFAEGQGYSLSVALNFTQTKMEMPKTKQISMKNFFTSHKRILNKMSTCEDSPSNLVQSSSSLSSRKVVSGMKRDRDVFPETSNSYKASEWEHENFTEPEGTGLEKPTSIDPPFLHFDSTSKEENAEGCQLPLSKRRLYDSNPQPHNLHSVPQPWSQDPLLTWSQFSETESDLIEQKHTITMPSSPNSLQSVETFENWMNVEGRTSTQKQFKLSQSSGTDEDKENNTLLSLYSPHSTNSFSNIGHKETNPKLVLPQKATTTLAAEQQSKDVEDSFSALFTQDSQGFRVIAHRGPLRDHRNIFSGAVRYSSVDDEDEEEMLFTQDSQGNVVIKH